MIPRPATPTLDRMLAIRDQAEAIGEFLDWLFAVKGIHLAERHEHVAACDDPDPGVCGWRRGELTPAVPRTGRLIEELLAEYFGLDEAQAESERRALLAAIRQRGKRGS